MTVQQLKSALEHYPEDAIVLVPGYEGGYSDIGKLKETMVKLDHYKEEWYGPHEEVENAEQSAILLVREPNPNALTAGS